MDRSHKARTYVRTVLRTDERTDLVTQASSRGAFAPKNCTDGPTELQTEKPTYRNSFSTLKKHILEYCLKVFLQHPPPL